MSGRWHFFDTKTGLFTGRSLSAQSGEWVERNTPEGCGAFLQAAGQEIDYLSQRVDLETGEVIDYQPPAPGDDHEWNASTKRWGLSAEAQQAIDDDRQARAAILLAEANSARAIREGLLELLPEGSPARQKLQGVEDAIAAERPNIIRKD